MSDIERKIKELAWLTTNYPIINKDDIGVIEEKIEDEDILEYLHNLDSKVKPETACEQLFQSIAKHFFSNLMPQVSIKHGFTDYIVQENDHPPVGIEIKPLYKRDKDRLKLDRLYPQDHERQIKKYLLDTDYILLTNLDTILFFNREAVVRYKPFEEMEFQSFFTDYIHTLWDRVRSIEDGLDRPGLDAEFFEDLTKWQKALVENVEFINDESADELSVLLLNKFIFIKTLEDFGLIPYRYIADEYKKKLKEWKPKSLTIALDRYFAQIEEWFNLYYDTELFRRNVFKEIKQDKANIERFRKVFEDVMGLTRWLEVFGKGLTHYTYRHIDEDVFGKSYEKFLARNRKDEGIYYTPAEITRYMVKDTVNALFDPVIKEIGAAIEGQDYDVAVALVEDKLFQIRIVDPTCGSGSFMIKVLRAVYDKYLKIYDVFKWAMEAGIEALDVPDDVRERNRKTKAVAELIGLSYPMQDQKHISRIILRHVFGIDKDPGAIAIAKTNIWKEAVKLKPAAFDYRDTGEMVHILPDLELNFIAADSLLDIALDEQIDYLTENHKTDIARLYEIHREYLAYPFSPEVLQEAIEIKKRVRTAMGPLISDIPGEPCLIALEFFFAYFTPDGEPLPAENRGLSAVISNPPWETIKPIRKEYAKIGKGKMDVVAFDKWFKQELVDDPEFKEGWEEYRNWYKVYGAFLRENYDLHGKGDLNYYKLFIERDLNIIRSGGYINVLVPSGIQTDEGAGPLRKRIFDEHSLLKLLSFENKGCEKPHPTRGTIKEKLFADLHPQFKFSILYVGKTKAGEDNEFQAHFYMHCPEELDEPHLEYKKPFIERFSPDNLGIIECRNERDMEVARKIRGEHRFFGDTGFELTTDFHMTNDSGIFKRNNTKNANTLYEGKMIYQYEIAFEEPRYFVLSKDGRNKLSNSEIRRIKKFSDNDFAEKSLLRKIAFDYQIPRFVFRTIGSSTNERSLIGAILPADVFIGNSLSGLRNSIYTDRDNDNITQILTPDEDKLYLLALFNSLTLNYYLRLKISANLNMFFIKELPIPEVAPELKEDIVRRAAELVYCDQLAGFCAPFGITGAVEGKERITKRAELEVLVARDAFGLNRDDFEYILGTFIYGRDESPTRIELESIKTTSLDIWE